MDISFIVGCIFGSMIVNYFWLRHLRTDIITHIDEIAFRLDNHIDDEKQERTRKHNNYSFFKAKVDSSHQDTLCLNDVRNFQGKDTNGDWNRYWNNQKAA